MVLRKRSSYNHKLNNDKIEFRDCSRIFIILCVNAPLYAFYFKSFSSSFNNKGKLGMDILQHRTYEFYFRWFKFYKKLGNFCYFIILKGKDFFKEGECSLLSW